MKIGELARSTGFKDKTIRYYERQGLLPDPGRTSSGYREYGPEDVDRLKFVKKAKRLGFSLRDIKSILQIHSRKEPTCTHVRTLLDEKLARVDALVKDLRAVSKELARLRAQVSDVEDCRPAGGRVCGIIENSAFGASQQALELLGRGTQQAE
ncbi:MAG: heavy metal-responsive transcriptional regulator [Chloroflexi bacterium]|nr:heavy metal-responsive transcriptional regulator [Chloroflexota bacterium]